MASFHADFIPRSPKILLHRSSFLPLKNRKALTMHIYTYIYTHTHVESRAQVQRRQRLVRNKAFLWPRGHLLVITGCFTHTRDEYFQLRISSGRRRITTQHVLIQLSTQVNFGLKVIYDTCFFDNEKTKLNFFDFIEFKVF